ncbi:Retrovirus-related Pol polyprotein from transposon gypsy [Dictyocoela roeselum]|nr:Retrovirus-related Pol polyprotein from transposon gypsy [Dictyocoela roeselum]
MWICFINLRDAQFYKTRFKSGVLSNKNKRCGHQITGFRVLGNTYAFLRVPFGFTNATFTFKNAINTVLEGIENVYCYIDDILIASKNQEDHYNDVEKVLRRLKEKHRY